MLRSGVDVIEVHRIDHAILRHGDRFFERFYTQQELIDSNGQTPALAARIAAKRRTRRNGLALNEGRSPPNRVTAGETSPVTSPHRSAPGLSISRARIFKVFLLRKN